MVWKRFAVPAAALILAGCSTKTPKTDVDNLRDMNQFLNTPAVQAPATPGAQQAQNAGQGTANQSSNGGAINFFNMAGVGNQPAQPAQSTQGAANQGQAGSQYDNDSRLNDKTRFEIRAQAFGDTEGDAGLKEKFEFVYKNGNWGLEADLFNSNYKNTRKGITNSSGDELGALDIWEYKAEVNGLYFFNLGKGWDGRLKFGAYGRGADINGDNAPDRLAVYGPNLGFAARKKGSTLLSLDLSQGFGSYDFNGETKDLDEFEADLLGRFNLPYRNGKSYLGFNLEWENREYESQSKSKEFEGSLIFGLQDISKSLDDLHFKLGVQKIDRDGSEDIERAMVGVGSRFELGKGWELRPGVDLYLPTDVPDNYPDDAKTRFKFEVLYKF